MLRHMSASASPLPLAEQELVVTRTFKAPRELVVVPSIGRAPNGKVDYKASRERALAALGVGA